MEDTWCTISFLFRFQKGLGVLARNSFFILFFKFPNADVWKHINRIWYRGEQHGEGSFSFISPKEDCECFKGSLWNGQARQCRSRLATPNEKSRFLSTFFFVTRHNQILFCARTFRWSVRGWVARSRAGKPLLVACLLLTARDQKNLSEKKRAERISHCESVCNCYE